MEQKMTTNQSITDEDMQDHFFNVETVDTISKLNDPFEMENLLNSDYITQILQIPEYLSLATNINFKQMILTKILPSISWIDFEIVEHICILMHQIEILKLEKSLWLHYLNSGTGKLLQNEFNLKVWPLNVKKIIEHNRIPSDNDDDDDDDTSYVSLIQGYLRTFNEKQQQVHEELSLKQKQFSHYTNTIDEILHLFIQEHFKQIRFEYNYRMKLIEFNYREQIFEHSFYQQNPLLSQITSVKRLLNYKYIYEETKEELQWIKQKRNYSSSNEISLPSAIQSINDKDLREYLSSHYDRILKRYNDEITKLLIDTMEAKLTQSKKLLDDELGKLWHNQRILSVNERLTPAMINIMDGYLELITDKLQFIYQHKNRILTK